MMLALDQAGALHSQSPVGAKYWGGDRASMVPRFAELLVNIDHIRRINELAGGAIGTPLLALLHDADITQIVSGPVSDPGAEAANK